jgi:hypothetical protein
MTTRRFYAARHTHDRMFAYPEGWTAFTFFSREARDGWVEASNEYDYRHGYNPCAEACTRDDARKISGSRTCEGASITRSECGLDGNPDVVVGYTLETADGYYNPYYWGR